MRQVALYIHIPFCKSKCPYCDFVSYEEHGMMTEYIDSLRREIASHSESGFEIKSIFFGGGTPNLVNPELLERIFKTINSCFKITPGAEVTIEINPEFADAELFEHYLKMGINRISIGVQSFNDTNLKGLGRIHNASQSIRAFEQARQVGFDNINMDLIYGIPGQSLNDWENDLNIIGSLGGCPRSPDESENSEDKSSGKKRGRRVAWTTRRSRDADNGCHTGFVAGAYFSDSLLTPEHVSVYPLTISESCKWGKSGSSFNQDEDLTADMYEMVCGFLPKLGLKQYEISNFSKNGFECKHNLAYWKCEEYLGVGVGAHSLMGNIRYENTRSLSKYIDKINNNQQIATHKTKLSQEDIQSEIIFMNLRLNKGLNISEYEKKTGDNFFKSYQTQITSLLNDGLVNLKDKKLSLTDKARPVANEVFCNFV